MKRLKDHTTFHLRSLLMGLFLFLQLCTQAQENPLDRKIDLRLMQVRTDEALKAISRQGKFLLSYNANGVDEAKLVTVTAVKQPVRAVLEATLGHDFLFRSGGSHVIIIPKKSRKNPRDSRRYAVSGVIRDSRTNDKVSYASIYEVGEFNTTLSNSDGTYSLQLNGRPDQVKLLISRKNYRDTVISVRPEQLPDLNIRLRPKEALTELPSLPATIPTDLNENALFKTMVSSEQYYQTENLPLYEQRMFQCSFVPTLGTNRSFGGLVENHVSLNLLGGYSMALSGVEVAGFFNITRNTVKGLQIGGYMNITGGSLYGFQAAGFMNNNIGSINGVQAAGFCNVSLDSLNGVQAAGFFNLARNRVKGVQVAGFVNISGKELDGVQAAGFLNLSGKSASGVQASGFCNIASGDMNGVQASGGINICTQTAHTFQVAGIANFANRIYGSQVSSLFNIAGRVGGSQIGLVNICDTVRGISVGILCLVRQGYHKAEVSTGDFNKILFTLRTGTHRFYNIISAGMITPENVDFTTFGYGLGTEFRHGKHFFFGIDVVPSAVFNHAFVKGKLPDFWGRSNLYLGYRPVKWVEFFGGPTMNAYAVNSGSIDLKRPSYGSDAFTTSTGNWAISGWWGWQTGIRFF